MENLKTLFLHPVIIGHRGFMAKYPENTITSFSAAMAAGAHMIELDVHLTKDRRLAVIHDEAVNRTTNGRGLVSDFSFEKLRKLDAGGWFHPRFSGEQIPVLEDVLDLVRNRLWVNIEIKVDPEDTKIPYDTVDRVIEQVKDKNAENFTLVSSFSMGLLRYLRSQTSDLNIGVLTYKKKEGFLDVCKDVNALAWHPGRRYFTREEFTAAKDAGLKILPYTVNEKEDMTRLIGMGVDGFFTNDPELGLAVIKGR